jgi:molybdopterin converting factor small subunit
MSVTVRVPPVFRTLTGGTSQVAVEGDTVGSVLDGLEAAHPGFKEKLLDGEGNLVRYVNVFVDDDDVRFLDGLATKVPDGTTVAIMQAVAGGA